MPVSSDDELAFMENVATALVSYVLEKAVLNLPHFVV